MDPITLRQDAARGRNDDGSQTTATWKALANTTYSLDKNDAVSGLIDFRHRFVLQEIGGGGKNNWLEAIQFSKNGGTWTNVGSGTDVQWTSTSGYADGDNTTQQVGSGTFVTTNLACTEIDFQGASASPDMAGFDEFECEFMLRIIAANFTTGVDDFRLRTVIGSGFADLDQYNSASLFDITIVDSTPPAGRRRIMFT